MCKFLSLRLIIAASLCILHALGASIYVGGAGESISVAENWDPVGLPLRSGNVGIIESDAGWNVASAPRLVNYHLQITSGVLSRFNFSNKQTIDGGVWEFDGGFYIGRALSLVNGAEVIVNSGGIRALENKNDDITLSAGSSLTIHGGETIASDTIGIDATGGTITINGGTLSSRKFASNFNAAGTYNLNGGIIRGGDFGSINAKGVVLNFGVGSVGSVLFESFNSTNVTIDWSPKSLMSLTITDSDQSFYEALYRQGSLLFAGSNKFPFSDNFEVSGSTLKKVDIPELSNCSLLFGLLTFAWSLSRANGGKQVSSCVNV
ncbi:MAG TPA: hypothetical protein DCX06_01425 [Opitutae bacterium]|nr:hypothetical protein [Opitutae bacterium]